MKKIILSTLAVFSFVIITNAQGFHLGLKGGVNLGKIDGQSFDQGFNAGFQLGAFAQIDFSKVLGIEPELLFNQTNTKYDTTLGQAFDISNAKNISLNYLSVPVLLRINASKLLTLNVGPQYSILMNNDQTLAQNVSNAFKSGDFAMVFGAQLNFGGINVYGRYNIGLSNISDLNNQDSWKSQQIQLGVGLRLL
jgi:hypothetical protein